MKKLFIAFVATALLITACHAPKPAPHHCYARAGYYYLDGTIITMDGNIWDFQTDAFTMPETAVQVIFDDNATPENIYDDIILCATEQNN